jgi:hypothetical protein
MLSSDPVRRTRTSILRQQLVEDEEDVDTVPTCNPHVQVDDALAVTQKKWPP